MKNQMIKIAKNLIQSRNKEELYSLFSICKTANVDISKEINYDYKKEFQDSKVLMITLNLKEYYTEDKYVEDYSRCYIEIDNMVEEGIESVRTVQSKGRSKEPLLKEIVSALDLMKKEIVKEIVVELLDMGEEPESFFSDFKILYHYVKGTENHIREIKDEIQRDLSKKEFEEIKKEALMELETLKDILKDFSSGEDYEE